MNPLDYISFPLVNINIKIKIDMDIDIDIDSKLLFPFFQIGCLSLIM